MAEKKKIMHVDDNGEQLELVKEILGEEYDVISVTSGKECLEKYSIINPDLVLLDVMMPEMNGFDVFNEIKKLDSDAKIAFLTIVDITAEDVDTLKERGIDPNLVSVIEQGADYIIKPYNPKSLRERVKKILG